jgi:F-type H+-transporting ATPase subunit delta
LTARDGAVARVYAETLLGVAREHGSLDRVAADVESLRRVLEGAPRLTDFLRSPRIPQHEKRAVLRRAFQQGLSPEVLRFLELVLERRRQDVLGDILRAFDERVRRLRNEEVVRVTSAVPLEPGLRARLVDAFARATGRRILLEETLDSDLLGGVVVQVGDRRLDGSLRSRLDDLRERMRRGAHAASAA